MPVVGVAEIWVVAQVDIKTAALSFSESIAPRGVFPASEVHVNGDVVSDEVVCDFHENGRTWPSLAVESCEDVFVAQVVGDAGQGERRDDGRYRAARPQRSGGPSEDREQHLDVHTGPEELQCGDAA